MKEFQGYSVHQAIPRRAVREVIHDVREARDAAGNRRIEDRLLLTTDDGPAEFLVSKGSVGTLPLEDFLLLRGAVLEPQAK